MKELCGVISHTMDELIVIKHKVDGNQLLIYIYTYMHIFCHTFIAVRRLHFSFVTMYWTKVCMNFIQIDFFLYILFTLFLFM